MDYTLSIQSQQREHLLNILQEKEFGDVRFIIGKTRTEFNVNRLFLASISPVFKAMLYGHMKESKLDCDVIIEDIDCNAFKSVLNYAYCNDPQITATNVLSVRYICDKYQITSLAILCESYFTNCLKSENLCYLLNGAVLIKSNKFIKTCQNAIKLFANEADKIIKSKGFLDLSINAMILFLQSDDLNVKEEELWQYVVKWAQFQSQRNNLNNTENTDCIHSKNNNNNNDNLSDDNNDDIKSNDNVNNNKNNNNYKSNEYKIYLLKSVRQYIRFGLMNGSFFVKNVKPLNCLTNSEMVEIFSYMHCNDLQCGLFKTVKRGIRKRFVINRGNIGNSCDWTYAGGNDVDAICITSNKDIQLTGIGVFDCNGTIYVKCKIYKGDNDNNNGIIIGESEEEIFVRNKATKEPIELILNDGGVNIMANIKYTVEISQKNSNGDSFYVKPGKQMVMDNNVRITFSEAAISTNSTRPSKGAIPNLYCEMIAF